MEVKSECYLVLVGRIGPTTTNGKSKDLTLLVNSMPCTLGRKPDAAGHLLVDASDSNLSREHIAIQHNAVSKSFEVCCLSKNGIVVDGNKVRKGEVKDILPGTAIKFGAARFYTCFPEEYLVPAAAAPKATKKRKSLAASASPSAKAAKVAKSDKPTSAAKAKTTKAATTDAKSKVEKPDKAARFEPKTLINNAFDSNELNMEHGGALQSEIVEWIFTKMKIVGEDKDKTKKSVYNCLNRTACFTRVADIKIPGQAHGTGVWTRESKP